MSGKRGGDNPPDEIDILGKHEGKGMKIAKRIIVVLLSLPLILGLAGGLVAYADDNETDWEEYFGATGKYSGSLYHIDIVAEGEFTYVYDPDSKDVLPLIEISKTWTDADTVDHSGDSVTVYLLDEDHKRITDSSGEDVTVTLDASNDWKVSLTDREYNVYYVEEADVTGYTASYSYAEEKSDNSDNYYTNTGTITVTSINEVSYVSADGKTYTIKGDYYESSEDTGRTSDWALEFFCGDDVEYGKSSEKDSYDIEKNNILRRLGYYSADSTYVTNEWGGYYGPLDTTCTIYINLTYSYEYVNENNETVTGSETTTLTFNAGSNNACSEVYDYETNRYEHGDDYTFLGYDAVVTADMLTKAIYDNSSTRTATITNTPDTVDISVTKEWDDDENAEGVRPESVTVKLYADGEDTGKTLTLNEENSWAGTFEDLSKYDSDGKEIAYSVEEDSVEGYTASISRSASEGYVITNSLDTGNLTITKTVNGTEAADEAFTFTITLDEEINGTYDTSDGGSVTFTDGVAAVTLYAGDSVTIEGLPAGMTYTVAETDIPDGYELDSSESSGLSGTLDSNTTVTASVVNTYSVVMDEEEEDSTEEDEDEAVSTEDDTDGDSDSGTSSGGSSSSESVTAAQTGDTADILPWFSLLGLSMMTMTGIAVFRKKSDES